MEWSALHHKPVFELVIIDECHHIQTARAPPSGCFYPLAAGCRGNKRTSWLNAPRLVVVPPPAAGMSRHVAKRA